MTALDTAAIPNRHDRPGIPEQPSDILLQLIVGVLAPLFMAGCAGDLGSARLAAMETLAAYQARTQSELVKIAQIIAFGLAAMDNLRLSMTPDLSLSMIARLRAGAQALNRAAQQNARALEKARRDNPPPEPARAAAAALAPAEPEPVPLLDDAITETDIQTSIERARAAVKAARDRLQAATTLPPATQPAAVQPPAAQPRGLRPPPASALPPAPPVAAEQRHKLMWADAMSAVAGELSANLAIVPPAQRGADRMWASALSSSASSLALAAGSIPPGTNIGIERVDKRTKPD